MIALTPEQYLIGKKLLAKAISRCNRGDSLARRMESCLSDYGFAEPEEMLRELRKNSEFEEMFQAGREQISTSAFVDSKELLVHWRELRLACERMEKKLKGLGITSTHMQLAIGQIRGQVAAIEKKLGDEPTFFANPEKAIRRPNSRPLDLFLSGIDGPPVSRRMQDLTPDGQGG